MKRERTIYFQLGVTPQVLCNTTDSTCTSSLTKCPMAATILVFITQLQSGLPDSSFSLSNVLKFK